MTKFGQLAVVTRLKKDTLTLTKKGGKYASSIDSRILITVKPNVFKTNATLSLQVKALGNILCLKQFEYLVRC